MKIASLRREMHQVVTTVYPRIVQEGPSGSERCQKFDDRISETQLYANFYPCANFLP